MPGLISCAGVTGSGCITYHAYATLLSGNSIAFFSGFHYLHVHVSSESWLALINTELVYRAALPPLCEENKLEQQEDTEES